MADEEQKTNGELKPQRPEYVSEKFWNADTSEVNLEDLASSYNSLEKKLGSRTEELSKQIRSLKSAIKEYETKDIVHEKVYKKEPSVNALI